VFSSHFQTKVLQELSVLKMIPRQKRAGSNVHTPYDKQMRRNYGDNARYFGKSKNRIFRGEMSTSKPNVVLRVQISNPAYKINTDTLHYCFCHYGTVVRIVIFGPKPGIDSINAMVEMQTKEG
jgi:hypothetical protein